MRRLNAPLLVRAIVLALVLTVAMIVPAAADSPNPPRSGPVYPELSGSAVTSYDVSTMPPLANAKRQIVQGTSGPQGCIVTHTTSRSHPAPGAPVPVTRELAFDPTSCRYLEEVGTLDAATVGQGSAGTRFPSSQERPPGPFLPGYQYGYQYRVEWYDPVGYRVSHADPYAGWNSNGSTVYNCAGNTTTGWGSPTGWWEKSKSISVYYSSGNRACVSEGWVVHENNVFCSKVTTDVYYQPVRLYGWYDGSVSLNTTTWDSGGCYTWLHYNIVGPYPI